MDEEPDYGARRKTLHERLDREGIGGYYTDDLRNLRYLAGFRGTAGSLLLGGGESVLFLDGRYRHYGQTLEAPDLEVHLIDDDRLVEVDRRVGDMDLDGIHFERSNITYDRFRRIVETVEVPHREYGPDWVLEQRTSKDDFERNATREAIRRTLDLFGIIETWVEPGISERALSRSIRRELESRSEGLAFDPLVLIGERTANPHSPSTDRSLAEGDPLLVDMGLKVDGYCSDLTRMFFCGGAEHPSRELYDLSKRAVAKAFDRLEPGGSLAAAARTAHDWIRESDHGDHLRHGLGHGVGLNVHEPPRLSEKSDESARPGMIVTLEPGIYVDGVGGGRIEHMAWIGEDEVEILDEPSEYIEP